MDADAVFHQQHYKLFPVHQGDWGLVGLGRFLEGTPTYRKTVSKPALLVTP